MWTSEEEFDFEGRFYKIKKGWLQPKPIQKPHPVVMNAGGSDKGRQFAAQILRRRLHRACSRTSSRTSRRSVERYRKLAREEYGRDIQVWTNAYIVQGETEEEAQEFFDYYVHEKGDWEAWTIWPRSWASTRRPCRRDVAAGVEGAFHRRLGRLSDRRHQGAGGGRARPRSSRAGFDGVILSWASYVEQMREFQEKTYPLMVQAGLR